MPTQTKMIYALGNLINLNTFNGYVGPVKFTGPGLDDGVSGGAYTGKGSLDFVVEIDASVPSPDTFKWSKDGGATWEATGVVITAGVAQDLSDGVTFVFAAGDGHTVGNKWEFTAGNVSTEHTIYKKEWLYNQRPSKTIRFTSITTGWIIIDLGSDKRITFAGIFNHNLVNPSTFQMRLYKEATGAPNKPGDAAPGFDFEGDFTFCSNHNNSGMKITDDTYRYIALCITDVGNTANLELGEFVITVWTRFTNFYIRSDSEGPTFFTSSQQTYHGQDWDVALSECMRFVLMPLQDTEESGALDEVRLFLQAIKGSAGRFIYVPNEDYCASKCQCYYVKIEGADFLASRVASPKGSRLDWSLPLKELIRGVGLLG